MAERLHELHLLIRDYDTVIAELQVSQEAYETFFTQLAASISFVALTARQAVLMISPIRERELFAHEFGSDG